MNPTSATQATTLNNEGIYHVNEGRYDEAITKISKALSIVKDVLAVRFPEPTGCEAEDLPNMHQAQTPSCIFLKHTEAATVLLTMNHDISMPDGDPFVFQNPIFVPTDIHQNYTFKYFVKLSYILLYNLALANHMSAALGGVLAEKKLRKALSLYELAYTIQMTEEIELTVLQNMAIVNNLGHIHKVLRNEEKAERCFEHLLSTIMFLNDCGQTDSVSYLDGFLVNVLPLILRNQSLAPAA